MITQRKYLIPHPAFISLFVLNFVWSLFFIYIDEGNYSFQELQHIYTWGFVIAVAVFFTIIGLLLYRLLGRLTTLSMSIRIILAGIITIPVIALGLMIISGIVQLFI